LPTQATGQKRAVCRPSSKPPQREVKRLEIKKMEKSRSEDEGEALASAGRGEEREADSHHSQNVLSGMGKVRWEKPKVSSEILNRWLVGK